MVVSLRETSLRGDIRAFGGGQGENALARGSGGGISREEVWIQVPDLV